MVSKNFEKDLAPEQRYMLLRIRGTIEEARSTGEPISDAAGHLMTLIQAATKITDVNIDTIELAIAAIKDIIHVESKDST